MQRGREELPPQPEANEKKEPDSAPIGSRNALNVEPYQMVPLFRARFEFSTVPRMMNSLRKLLGRMASLHDNPDTASKSAFDADHSDAQNSSPNGSQRNRQSVR